ncbi:hypothetical protein [Chamaesiphon sp. VAR_69_metabat_338]|uniref:hypothetical protein n=1 Tax=Chamaesiphon sp. VAR_69_metabat_338 TaxID=2964704 RepID=UPI00286EA2C1|nr:hypothetical protein [Chamaesiphon sp. VAR_69_metabat_338]
MTNDTTMSFAAIGRCSSNIDGYNLLADRAKSESGDSPDVRHLSIFSEFAKKLRAMLIAIGCCG